MTDRLNLLREEHIKILPSSIYDFGLSLSFLYHSRFVSPNTTAKTSKQTKRTLFSFNTMSTRKDFFVDFEVKFGKSVISVEMPASASVHDLKQKLEAETHVRAEKQRLLLNLPVMKEKHRDPPHSTLLRHLFPAALVERCEQHEGHIAQHLRVSAMLLGSAEAAPPVNVAATTEISRLVATTVEHDGKWYRCSYSKGYQRQTAYVCRTCIDAGRADPQHAVCLACAEFCHGNHEVEEWGVRHYMRCDCCTEKCWWPATTTANALEEGQGEAESRGKEGVTAAEAPAKVESGAGAAAAGEVRTVQRRDIEDRTTRKRSRSTSPLTPKRSRGSSPMSGIRMTTIPPADMPDLDLHPAGANAAITTNTAATATSLVGAQPTGGGSEGPVVGGLAPSSKDDGDRAVRHAAAASVSASGGTASGFPTAPSAVAPAAPLVESMGSEAVAEGAAVMLDNVEGSAPPPLPHLSRCAFVIDSKTKRAPVESVLPTNKLNRYPRDALNWCYCKMPHPSDDPECGGIACLLCASCYWSTHITRLFTGQYRRMPCYGDVLVGDTVAFKCNTCNTYVCTPCRYRCHKDHDIAPGSVVPSVEDGTDNGAVAGAKFSCGCRGLCAIAETVPEELIDDESAYALISDADAVELINNDVFTGFLCAHCMQEHPWLATADPLHCYHGELPPKVESAKPIVACGTRAASPTRKTEDADTFPYHGMLLPVNAFTPDMTCGCAPCRAAYEKFAPRALEDATEMIMELHDQCDNCGRSVKDQQAFMCRTCEMNMDDTYFICRDCNALRQVLVANRDRVQSALLPPVTGTSSGRQDDAAASSATVGSAPLSSSATTAEEDAAPEHAVDAEGYNHDLSHEFIEDTFENLYALCGMQMMQNSNPEVQEMVAANWNPETNQAEVANALSQSFGQVPLQFSDAELREMATLNHRRKQSQGDTEDSNNKGGK